MFRANGVLSRSSGAQRPSYDPRWSRGCLENDRMVFVATPTGRCLMVSPARVVCSSSLVELDLELERDREPRGGFERNNNSPYSIRSIGRDTFIRNSILRSNKNHLPDLDHYGPTSRIITVSRGPESSALQLILQRCSRLAINDVHAHTCARLRGYDTMIDLSALMPHNRLTRGPTSDFLVARATRSLRVPPSPRPKSRVSQVV